MDRARADQLYATADAARWNVPLDVFVNAIERGAEKAFVGRTPSDAELDRYFDALHLADVALSCACAMGKEPAWDYFVNEFRPAMYRAADALDPSGSAREIAESLYAELFGLREKDGIRQSVFRYFHGRSSLATWLRALVVQRYIDRHRERKRLVPLPDQEPLAPEAPLAPLAPCISALRAALAASIAMLEPRDRLRLACYYAQEMTLAQIARLTREHESTVSRQLARTRAGIRADVEHRLRDEHGFSPAQIAECFDSLVNDAGDLDIGEWLGVRKERGTDRSSHEASS